jgi:hypothetical protein
VIWFRHADRRYPFLWETADQPPGRWHGPGEGPVQYMADTPDGAWAEFLRHEEIHDPADLDTVTRAVWAIEVPGDEYDRPQLPEETLTGGRNSYPECQDQARRLRMTGAPGLIASSAALLPAQAAGWHVSGGVEPGPDRDGRVLDLFGRQPDLVGWAATVAGRPGRGLLAKVRHMET